MILKYLKIIKGSFSCGSATPPGPVELWLNSRRALSEFQGEVDGTSGELDELAFSGEVVCSPEILERVGYQVLQSGL